MIFLYLHKTYDALDRDRCLEILEVYSVGPRACRLLQTYWGRLRMVAKAGGVIQVGFTGLQVDDAGRPAVPHHLQRGGGFSGETLVRGDGVECG